MIDDNDFIGVDGRADVAVIVVTYNSSDDIGHLLADLRREARENVIRVVLVDNDSTDGTRDIVARHHDVVLISAGGNIGYAGGINVARRQIGDCRAVLILNPDLRVRAGTVGTMLRILDRSRIGVVVPRIVDADGLTYPSLRSEPSVVGTLGDSLFGHHFDRRHERWSETVWNPKRYHHPHEIDWATGAALLIRADVDRAVGDWDERYFLYSEEVDYFRRIRASGALIWFDPRAVVEHRGAGSGSSPELATLMSVNRVRYFDRYHGELQSASHRAMVMLGEALRSYDSGHRKTLRVLCNSARWVDLPKASPPPLPVGGVALGAVIIPAHNESSVIGRTLEPLVAAAASGVIELIVVCNGCTDDTANVARAYLGVTVVETAEASKITALNLGDATARLWPRLYLDADITITITAVAQVLAALRSGSVLAARPSSMFDVSGADALVRSYYRARSRIAWFRTALWGAGAYGLSEAGHHRIGPFPSLTGDDLWVDAQFVADEKCVVETAPAMVVVPRDRNSLLHMMKRVYRGKAEVAEAPSAGQTLRAVIDSVRGPQSAWDAGVYVVLTLVARRRARWARTVAWERDDSSRTAIAV
ncbi:glycosyltransferase family 2 protein [Williamsia sp.]|uniref:glycosyltransferase family 2 protein n=1 Tax=Williamsia sp. TaxID=1872085 RepID=UPI002F955DCF